MSLVEEQFERLKKQWNGAEMRLLPSGAVLITIPSVPLEGTWNQQYATVRFLAPVGYPHAKPDCFWTDPALRLANGGLPQASSISNPIPEAEDGVLWFSWHANQWYPNRDDLLTYLNVIRTRLRQGQ